MELSDKIISLIEQARKGLAKTTNSIMVLTYFHIGKLIVEEFQEGEQRAEYGSQLLEKVSIKLTSKLGRGYSVQNLERMRNFYLVYSNSSNNLRNSEMFQKSSSNLGIFKNEPVKLLPLSWSHYLLLLQVDNELERQFYEIESFQNNWKLEELKRQYNSGLFERLSLSKNKEEILQLAQKGQIIQKPHD